MRHTLLPISEQHILQREYRTRLATVFCFILAVAGLGCVIALFPAFTRISIEDRSQTERAHVSLRGSGQNSLAHIEQEISLDASMLAQVSHASSATQISSVLYGIVTSRNQGIRLNSFSFARIASSTVDVTVQGVAVNRDSLVSYKNRLIEIPGSRVDLPLSELSKSADIQFSLKVTISLP